MRAYQAFTDEIDDLDLAVEELASQIEGFELSSNAGGVLFCGSEVDTSLLCHKLRERFHLPFIGTTCLGQFTGQGYKEAAICFNLVSGEDISFSGGMSGDLTSENMAEEIKEAYRVLKNKMDTPEEVIILYIPWYPGVVYDDILDALSEVSGGVPIFGGICSDEWEFTNCHALFSGGSFSNRASILLVGGNFKPKFETTFSLNWSSENSVTVTRASGAVVYEIDGQPALDYLTSIGLVFPYDNIFSDCLASPMIFTYTDTYGKEISIVRNLHSVNVEDGSATFAGRVLEGSQMKMALTSRIAIRQSLTRPIEQLVKAMEDDKDYPNTGVLVSSCTGRYCLTVADKNTECEALNSAIGNDIILAGGYLNGEFCPVRNEETGRYTTLLNNETFTLMAF